MEIKTPDAAETTPGANHTQAVSPNAGSQSHSSKPSQQKGGLLCIAPFAPKKVVATARIATAPEGFTAMPASSRIPRSCQKFRACSEIGN
jgi:hypothetical protein